MKKTIVSAIQPIATELANKGIKVSPKISSPIYELLDDGNQFTTDAAGEILYTIPPEKLNTIADKVSKIVNDETSFIKNTVIGSIEELIANVTKDMDSYSTFDPSTDIELVMVDDTYLRNSETFMMNINVYESSDTQHPINKSFTLPTVPIEKLNEVLSTQASKFDIPLEVIRTKITDESLSNIWNVYFSNIEPGKREIMSLVGEKDLYKIVVIFLLADYFSLNVIDNMQVRLADYELNMTNIAKHIGNLIVKRLQFLDSKSKSGSVILSQDKENNILFIYKPNYLEYIKENSVKAIYGTLFDNDPSVSFSLTIGNLIDNQDKLIAAWDKHAKLMKINVNLERTHILKTSFTTNSKTLIRGFDSEVMQAVGYVSEQTVTLLLDEVSILISRLSTSGLEDLRATSEKIIASTVFKNTNAEMFLNAMSDYATLDNSLDAMECASLASLKLITKFYTSMLLVDNV